MSDFEDVGRFSPGDPEDPHGDRATLRSLEEAGADLTKPTHFIHFLTFPDPDSARATAQAIADELGYEVSGNGDALRAEREQVPTLENVERMRKALTLFAEQAGGEYDGWEAAVTS